VHARSREKSLKNFGPVPTVSSLTLRVILPVMPTVQLVWLEGIDQRDGIIDL
jgi:hypothetical protein